jgi:hypothetical protein
MGFLLAQSVVVIDKAHTAVAKESTSSPTENNVPAKISSADSVSPSETPEAKSIHTTPAASNNPVNLNTNPAILSALSQPPAPGNKSETQALWKKQVGVAAYYNDELGMVTDLTYKQPVGTHQAAALEVEGGERIARVNATWGLAVNSENRIKVTAEHLQEKLDYDFASGRAQQWDGQNALGTGYQYLINNPYLDAVNLGSYYSHAGSKSLSDAAFTYDSAALTNSRRIAGANSGNVAAGISGHLWQQSQLSAALDYDVVNYDSHYQPDGDEDTRGFGSSFALEQRLLPRLKMNLNTDLRKPYNDYQGNVGWLLPPTHHAIFELAYFTNYTRSHTTERRFYSNGLRLNMNWDTATFNPDSKQYADYTVPSMNLTDWTSQAAVRMAEVLATTDQVSKDGGDNIIHIRHMQTTACPAVNEIKDEGNGSYSTSDGWFSLKHAKTSGDIVGFDEAREISDENGVSVVECLYYNHLLEDGYIDPTHTITLINANPNEYIETPIGTNWFSNDYSRATRCYGHTNNNHTVLDHDPGACTFEYDSERFAQSNAKMARKAFDKLHEKDRPAKAATLNQAAKSEALKQISHYRQKQ